LTMQQVHVTHQRGEGALENHSMTTFYSKLLVGCSVLGLVIAGVSCSTERDISEENPQAGAAGSGAAGRGSGGSGGSAGSGGSGGSSGSGGCGDVQTDPRNCGACGNDCTTLPNVAPGATGITCNAGACVVPDSACVAGKKHCTTTASDICETDITGSVNCGDCGVTCDAPQVCASGACVDDCTAAQTRCTSADGVGCYDLKTDLNHCGTCDTKCPVPASHGKAVCQNGCKIECEPGYHQCGNNCVADTDANNCGDKCVACTTNDPNATPKCNAGTCSYPCNTGYRFCGGQCVPNDDPNNCGACGVVCGATKTCKTGSCLLKDGYDCANAAECLSGSCSTFFVDADGDKHGAASGPKKVCGKTAPAGYVTSNDDCCDVGSDAGNIFPGQTLWFTSQAKSCSKGWDYNCSNNIEKEITNLMADCKRTTINGNRCPVGLAWSGSTVPDCSGSGNHQSCIDSGAASFCASSPPVNKVQGCH
jgi:hypothetical protein